jgi:xanthine dehydrogenase accessory factor
MAYELLQTLQQELETGAPVAVATLVRRRGSVPREVGAKMLVHRDGRISGTIGGGCGEAEVWRAALSVLDTGRPRIVQVSLTEEIALESQGVCGGTFEVFIQRWHVAPRPGQPSMCAVIGALQKALAQGQAVALATVVAAAGEWRAMPGQQLLSLQGGETLGSLPGGEAEVIQAVGTALQSTAATVVRIHSASPATWADIFIEPLVPPPLLLIAGAGHIAVPLAALGSLMKFSVSVTDDRAAFANRERFPSAGQILVGDIASILHTYPVTPHTYVVLVTRAHSHDVQGLRALLDSPAAFIGMIGSQRRVWAVLKLLHDEGVADEKLLRVHAPIGLDIGSQTPEEIALSIMSEIVLFRRAGTGRPLSESLRARYRARLQRAQNQDEVDEESDCLLWNCNP